MKPLFSISDQQHARLKEWMEKHATEAHFHINGVRDIGGAWLKFTIIPSGGNDNIEVECIWCKNAKIILTEDCDGEFLYDLEGRKTWCGYFKGKDIYQNMCPDARAHMQLCKDEGHHMKEVDRDGDCRTCNHH